MFAVSEVHATYAVVNYTRNIKGFLSLEGKEELAGRLEVGQLIVACVLQEGTTDYNASTSGTQNKKLQLSVDPEVVNKALSTESITPNMILQGIVESKEAKGFLINLGLKGKARGFVSFSGTGAEDITVGQLVLIAVKAVTAG